MERPACCRGGLLLGSCVAKNNAINSELEHDPFGEIAAGPVPESVLRNAMYRHGKQSKARQRSRVEDIPGSENVSVQTSGILAVLRAVAIRDDCAVSKVQTEVGDEGSEVVTFSLKDDIQNPVTCEDRIVAFALDNSDELGIAGVAPAPGGVKVTLNKA